MNFGQSFVQQLQEFLARENRARNDSQGLIFQTIFDKIETKVIINDSDKFSFLIQRLEIRGSDMMVTADKLKEFANLIISRLTYLVEHFQLVELDPHNLKLQLRSQPPQRADHIISFFEILMDQTGRLTLLRYEKDEDKGTVTTVPFQVTKDLLIKLTNDMIDAVRI